jgi:ABC-type nitrate/sulfonate/bicarbonate transport system substrate-binding protein
MAPWTSIKLLLAAVPTLVVALAALPAFAQTKLTVMVFQGMQNLPLLAAQSKGFFAKRGLDVDIKIAPSSDELRDGLAAGRYQIVHGAVDNAVAMAEVAKIDVSIVLGGDNGFNRLIVQPGIGSYADLRGKTVLVDAPDTAYAFLLYEMLRQNGLTRGDYVVKPAGASFRRAEAMLQDKTASASMLNPPFSLRVQSAGLKDMGSAVKAVGNYQATAAWVLSSWAPTNSDTLVRYIQAYIDGLRWGTAPSNKDEIIKMYVDALKLPEALAAQTYAIATDPAEGLAKDAEFDLDGFKNVLKLRSSMTGQWSGNPPAPEKYLDLSHYRKALAGL